MRGHYGRSTQVHGRLKVNSLRKGAGSAVAELELKSTTVVMPPTGERGNLGSCSDTAGKDHVQIHSVLRGHPCEKPAASLFLLARQSWTAGMRTPAEHNDKWTGMRAGPLHQDHLLSREGHSGNVSPIRIRRSDTVLAA